MTRILGVDGARGGWMGALTRIDDVIGKIGLVITEPHQHERFVGEIVAQPLEEGGIVAFAHALPPHVLIDVGRVAELLPVRRQIGPERVIPREVIGGEIREDEQRSVFALTRDDLRGLVIEKEVGLDALAA